MNKYDVATLTAATLLGVLVGGAFIQDRAATAHRRADTQRATPLARDFSLMPLHELITRSAACRPPGVYLRRCVLRRIRPIDRPQAEVVDARMPALPTPVFLSAAAKT